MKLSRWLEKKRLSEREASRRLGIPQSSISRITHLGKPPTLRNAAKIVRATNGDVTYEDLLGTEHRRELRRYNGRLLQVRAGA